VKKIKDVKKCDLNKNL